MAIDPRKIVTVHDLCVSHSGRPALAGIDMEVAAGEVLAVLGPNGAGKTTLLECLAGVRRADSGSIRHARGELRHLRDWCSIFAFMPDDAELPTELRVSEVLAHARRHGRTPPSLDAWLLERLAVTPLLGAGASQLSRGERRRVALYAALCTTRPIVVLDEPLGAFDPQQLRDVLAVLRARAAAGVAIVASVHQIADAEKIADRVLLLRQGRAVAFGTIDALRAQAGRPGASLEDVFLALLEAADDARA